MQTVFKKRITPVESLKIFSDVQIRKLNLRDTSEFTPRSNESNFLLLNPKSNRSVYPMTQTITRMFLPLILCSTLLAQLTDPPAPPNSPIIPPPTLYDSVVKIEVA
eukprot:SAG22_NODE_14593_length_370_cov_1.306273_1_plen_105_part_01